MYNKNKIQKTNEKKIMKKVKKQWVVASLATFALLGGGAISAVQTGSQQVAATEESITVSSSKTASDGYNDGIKAAKSETVDTIYNDQIQDYKIAYDNAKQGYLDGNGYNQNASNKNESYINAYSSNPIVQGANAGIESAKNNGNSTTENSEQKNSYEEAYKGYKDGYASTRTSDQKLSSSPYYSKAFDIGGQDAQMKDESDAQKGINEGIAAAQSDVDMTKSYSLNNINTKKPDDVTKQTGPNPTGSQSYKDAYNKAYNGVVDGTNKTQNTTLKNDEDYSKAYNIGLDIRNKTKTALVTNANQLHSAVMSSDIINVKATKDISMWDFGRRTSGSYSDVTGVEYIFSKALTIDGGGHTIDFARTKYTQTTSNDLTLKNLTMYGTDYYGSIRTNGSSKVTYDNIRYYGPQLINSQNAEIHINNNVFVDSRNLNYDPSKVTNEPTDSPGTVYLTYTSDSGAAKQQNIQAQKLYFEDGSQYDGYTSNGNVFELTGAVVVKVNNATVNLYPRGNANAENSKNGNAVGLYMSGTGSFDIDNNSHFNIYSQYVAGDSKLGTLADALWLDSTSQSINVTDGSELNVKINGPIASGKTPVRIGGNLNINNNSQFTVEKTGEENSDATLVDVTGGLSVTDKSGIGMYANGSKKYTLLQTSKKVDIQNPSNKIFYLNGNAVSGVVFDLRGNNNSYSKYITGQNIKLQAITINGIPYANVTIPNDYPASGKLLGTDVTSTQDSDKEPSDNNKQDINGRYLQFNATPNFSIENTSIEKNQATGQYKLNVAVKFMDSYSNYTNNDYPLYLGAFDGDNKTAINGTIENITFNLTTEKAYRYNTSTKQDSSNPTFSIALPANLTSKQIQNLQVRGQYIVGDDVYKLGLSEAEANKLATDTSAQKATEGATDFINNRSNANYTPNTDQYIDNSAYKTGYDKAKDGYAAGSGSNPQDGSSTVNEGYARNAYIMGFNQGKVDKSTEVKGYNDAINGKNSSPQDNTKFAYDKGYAHGEKIVQAIKDVLATPSNKLSDDQEYKDAYDAAVKVFKNQGDMPLTESESYKAGRENAQGIKDALNENPNTVDPNKDGVSAGYKLTARGIQDAKNNLETSEFSNSVFYQVGKNEYHNGKQAFLDGNSDPKDDTSKTATFKQAYADAADGYNTFDTDKNIDLSGKSQAFKDGYKTAQAVNDYLEGNGNEASDNPAYNNAYQGANDGASAVSNQTNISEADLKTKSQAFQKAYNATKKQTEGASDFAKDSTKGIDGEKSKNPNYKAGFEGARDGQTDGAKAGQTGNIKSKEQLQSENHPNSYIKAYQKASTSAASARKGALEYLKNLSKSEFENPAEKAGFDGAKDAKQNPETAKSTEANYQTGFNLAKGISDGLAKVATAVESPTSAYEIGVKSVIDGANAYNSGATKDSDKYKNDDAYKIGYDEAESAVKDFLAGEPAKDNNDGIYKDAYNKAVAGYNDVNKADDDSSVKQGNSSQAYKEGRQAAKAQQSGAKSYSTNISSQRPSNSGSQQEGYDGAKAGQQDGAAGITKSEEELKTANKSKAYKDAYNNANQQAKEARAGAQDAIKSDSSKYNQQETTEAYKKGYEGAQKGLGKDTGDVSKDANTQTGYNLGQGTQDALNSGVQVTTDATDKGYKAAYDAVKDGAKSYQAGNATDSDNENTKNQYSNNASYKKGYDTAKQAVEDFTTGRLAQSNDALYREIYQNTVDGYNNASRNESDKKADYKTGQESKNQGAAGSDAYQKQTDKEIKGKFYEDGYAGAKQSTEDGLAKKSAKTDFSGLTLAYKDAYEAAYPKAESARKGAEAALSGKSQSDLTSEENRSSDFMAGFNGAKAGFKGDQKVNDANAQYVAAYDRAQGIKDALANPTVELAASDTHSESYKAGYRDAQTGIAASLNKDSKAVDSDQAYSKGYDAVNQGVKDYQDGVTPMPTGKTKAYERGYTEAQSGHDDALAEGANAQAPSDSSKTKQYQESYNATRAALQGRDDYLNSRDKTNSSQYGSNQTSRDGYDNAYLGSKEGLEDYNSGHPKNFDQLKDKAKAYQDAYNTVLTMQKAMADSKDNHNKENDYSGESKSVYQNAYKAAQEAVKSTPQKEANASASYNYAYDSVKGASDYVNGRGEQDHSKNYQESYEQASKGHDSYKSSSTESMNNKTQAYKDGFDSAKSGSKGAESYQNQTPKESEKGTSYDTGYAGAKQATEDAIAKVGKKTDLSDKTQAYKDAYETAYPKAESARKGAESALSGKSQSDLTSEENRSSDFMSGFNGAKAGFKGDQKVNNANAQYVAAYDRAQGIKDALANPTVNVSESDTHSESYKAGYRDTQTGIAASLNKESKAADTDQAYRKGYDAVEQGVKDYQDGVTPMPTGKTKAYEKGYTEAQAGHDDALKSGLNKEEDLSGQSKQYQDSYKATKAALYGQKDYLSSRTQTNKNKYPDYQASYNEGFEGAKAGQSNGLSGASSNTKGKSAAYKVGYKFGYDSGYSSYLSNLGSGQLSGQNDGENGLPLADLSMYGGTYSSSYMAAYKQAYDNYQNGVAQADKDLTNGVKVDLSGKSKAYINGYNSISANMAQTTVSHIANEGVLIWDMVDGKPVQTTSYEHHQNSIRATKETKVVDGISYTKLANNRGWLQTKYLADPSSKAGVVNYISGYGVLVWNSGQNTMKSSETTELSLANVKTYDEKVIDGISYTRINAKDSDQWVQTQYLKPATPTPTSGVASVGNVPANHAIYLRDKDGNMTDQAIFADTSWKVFSQKRISGELYYCLGNDNQWIEAKYVTEFK